MTTLRALVDVFEILLCLFGIVYLVIALIQR